MRATLARGLRPALVNVSIENTTVGTSKYSQAAVSQCSNDQRLKGEKD